jgi:hypothetical protein
MVDRIQCGFLVCKRGQFVRPVLLHSIFSVWDGDIYFVPTELHGLTKRKFVNLTLISLKSIIS